MNNGEIEIAGPNKYVNNTKTSQGINKTQPAVGNFLKCWKYYNIDGNN